MVPEGGADWDGIDPETRGGGREQSGANHHPTFGSLDCNCGGV